MVFGPGCHQDSTLQPLDLDRKVDNQPSLKLNNIKKHFDFDSKKVSYQSSDLVERGSGKFRLSAIL